MSQKMNSAAEKKDRPDEVNLGWCVLLDELKAKEGIESDMGLADTLGVSRAFLSAIRRFQRNMPVTLAEKILMRLGRNLTQQELLMFIPLRIQKHTFLRRSSQAKDIIVQSSQGMCELCNTPAPFVLPNGLPYLEAHHVTPLSNGGEDTIENIVALCPNCHRKVELCPTEYDLKILAEKASTHSKS